MPNQKTAQPNDDIIEQDFDAREGRITRAAEQVLARYSIREQARRKTCRTFLLEGGQKAYTVRVDEEWGAEPACTCPDAVNLAPEKNKGYCKHIIAVLMKHDELRCQLLEMFL